MAKCPHCGATIEYLIFNWEETNYCTENYRFENWEGDIERDGGYMKNKNFTCPKCGDEVAYYESDADEILKTIEEEPRPGTNPNNNIIIL